MSTTRLPRPLLPPRSAFAGLWFPLELVVLAVGWYLGFGLSVDWSVRP